MGSFFSGLKSAFSQSKPDEPSSDGRAKSKDGAAPDKVSGAQQIESIEASNMSASTSVVGGAAATLAVLSGLVRPGTASADETSITESTQKAEDQSEKILTEDPLVIGVAPDSSPQETENTPNEAPTVVDDASPREASEIADPATSETQRAPVSAPTVPEATGIETAPIMQSAPSEGKGAVQSDEPSTAPMPEAVGPPNRAPDAEGQTDGSVDENSAAGTVVARLQATDADGDVITFDITNSEGTPVTDANFEISGNTVVVRAGADLDFETVQSFDLYVVARDGESTGAPQQISIAINDVAEVVQLGDGGVAFSDTDVTETAILGGSGGDLILGGSGDDILSGRCGDDVLSGGDGQDQAVFVGNLGDFDISYDVDADVFTVVDTVGSEGTDTLRGIETFTFGGVDYSVADMQTEATRQANTGPGSASVTSGGTVDENSAAGTVVATLGATDVDGDTLTFALTDAAGAPITDSNFEIVGNEVRVKPGAELDFESAASFDVFVTASDRFETSAPQQITFNVDDIAEVIRLGDGGVTYVESQVTETQIIGGQGSDTILGGAGDDKMSGEGGDDTLLGGGGTDTAVFSGDLSNFDVTYDAGSDTFTVTDQNAADGDEGTDTLSEIEVFDFNGVLYTKADLITEADRQANTAPQALIMSFARLDETVDDGGSIGAANDPSGATIGYLATGDLNAGDTHTYTLLNDLSGKFEVVGNEVRILPGAEIDYETDTAFDLTIRTTDQWGATYDEVLTLPVYDIEGTYVAGDSGETVTGTSEEDSITGGAGWDTIYGGAGDDTIDSGEGLVNSLYGGTGDDVLISGEGLVNSLYGGTGDDVLISGTGYDRFYGGTGADTMYGGENRDRFYLEDGFGSDMIYGGDSGSGATWSDRDSIYLDGVTAPVTITFTGDESGTITDGTSTATFDDIEYIGGTTGADTVDASGKTAFTYYDTGGGADTYIGGEGADEVWAYYTQTEGVYIDGGGGNDYINGTEGGDDTLIGGAGDDQMWTYGGTDMLYGGDGDDSLFGGSEADTLSGGDGNDTIDGADGNDLIREDENTLAFNGTGTDGVALASNFTGFPTTELSFEITYATTDTGNQVLASYAVPEQTNEFVFEQFGGNLSLVIRNERHSFSLDIDTLADGEAQTVGVTWDSVTGETILYVNGSAVETATLGLGHTFRADGSFTFGQEQDTVGGGFDPNQIFDGEFYGATLHNAVRTPTEMAESSGDPFASNLWDPALVSNWVPDGAPGQLTDLTGANTMTVSGDVVANIGGDDTISGGNGNDSIFGGAGADTVTGGSGDDTVFGGSDNDDIDGGTGQDHLYGGGGDDTLSGGDDNDEIYGGTGADAMFGGEGADDFWIEDGFGADVIDGGIGGGEDDLHFDLMSRGVTVTSTGAEAGTATDGIDTLSFTDIEDVDGSQFDDIIDFSADSSNMQGDGLGGNDLMIGGAGNDNLDGHGGDDTLFGGGGNDTLYAGSGNDNLSGGDGDDTLYAGEGADTLSGGDGDDFLDVDDSDGLVTISGGTGRDEIDFDRTGTHDSAFTVTFDGDGSGTFGANTGTASGSFSEIEVISGSDNADTIDASADTAGVTVIGNGGDDFITGGSGADALYAKSGDNTLIGGGGNDSLYAGEGIDFLDGGLGDDHFDVDDSDGTVTIIGGVGTDTLDMDAGASQMDGFTLTFDGDDTGTFSANTSTASGSFSGIEAVTGTSESDTIDAYANTTGVSLDGNGGDDWIWGGFAADTIEGGTGNDQLFGDEGNDIINGGDGDDLIQGQWGNDVLSGGAGNDTFELSYMAGTDTIDGNSGVDTVSFIGTDSIDVLATGDSAATYTRSGGSSDGQFSGIEAINGSTGNDTFNLAADSAGFTVDAGSGNDTITGGLGDDNMFGGSGDDTYIVTAGTNVDTINDSAGWTDIITMNGVGPGATVTGNTVDGDGWTMLLDAGSSVTGQAGNTLDLSDDAIGTITFDDGGTIDFNGIDRVTW
jgi:Ca2+-binding RTX toxin-like protein